MLYTKTYKKKALESLKKLDDELGKVEGALSDLSVLSKDTVKDVKGDYELEELLNKMSINISDLYVYKNRVADLIEKANEK